MRAKVAIIRGDNATKDEKLELRAVDNLTTLLGSGPVRVVRIAAVAHFSTTDWYKDQNVVLTADVNYSVPIRAGREGLPRLHARAVQAARAARRRGRRDRRGPLAPARVKLPGEKDGPLFAIATQPPESKQIDVLNVYNDGSSRIASAR